MARLVIRINNTGSSKLEPSSSPREIIEYRWDRIITALALLILVIVGTIWLLSRMWSTPDTTLAMTVGENEPILEAEAPTTTVVSITEPTAPSSEPATNPSSIGAPVTTLQSPASAPAVPAGAQAVSETAPQPVAVSMPIAAVDASKQPPTITLHSSNVLQAQLTSNVIQKQPVDQLGPEISMNGQGLIRVYLFTETQGLGGRPVFHDWYLNDRRMARVRLPSSDRPIVMSSSKFIDRHMRGDWRVEVRDDGITPLITARFRVTD